VIEAKSKLKNNRIKSRVNHQETKMNKVVEAKMEAERRKQALSEMRQKIKEDNT